jgi:osmoprotectant transport system permease protein
VAVNLALAGTLGVVLLGLMLDALFILLTRFTTPRGIRD